MPNRSARTSSKAAVSLPGDRRTPSRGESQRRAILDALATLLATRPIGDLTVGEIADAAGVLRSGYYFYFESKYSALAVATAEAWSELMAHASSFARLNNESPAESLTRSLRTAIAAWHEHEALLVASIQAIPLDMQLAQLWRDWNERLASLLTALVMADREIGAARPVSTDVPGLVATLLEMTLHMFYQDRLNKHDAQQTEHMLEKIRAIWLASAWGITDSSPMQGG
jgi:AcrR family transcriptional regulator